MCIMFFVNMYLVGSEFCRLLCVGCLTKLVLVGCFLFCWSTSSLYFFLSLLISFWIYSCIHSIQKVSEGLRMPANSAISVVV